MPYLTHWTYDVAPLYNSYKSLTTLSVFFDKKATDIPIFLCKFATLNEKTTIFTTMRVLIVNTSERTGGAAIAANRLKDALNNSGVKTMMLVTDKETALDAAKRLGLKYYPTVEEVDTEIEKAFSRVQMIALTIEHMTGKNEHEK